MEDHPTRRAYDIEQDYQDQLHIDIRKTRRMFYVSFAIIFVALLAMGTFAYWKTAPYKVFEIKQYKADVEPDTVVGDGKGSLTVSFDYCKYSPLQAEVVRTLVSSRISVNLPIDHQVKLPVGCGKAKRLLLIPKISNTGVYHIHYDVMYKVNPIRYVEVEYDTQDFQITNGGTLDVLP